MDRRWHLSWRWVALFALLAMLGYVWLWHSPDLAAVKQWAAEMSHHPLVVVGVIATMAITLAIGLPGSIGLWLIAPFYVPVIATAMLTLGSVLGALGAYFLATRFNARIKPGGLTHKVMQILERRGDLLTQCALRILPGFPHCVINYAAGLVRLPLKTYLLATVIGLSIKWGVYSSAIYGALEAIEHEDPLQFGVVLPLIALALLLLVGGWYRRRVEAARREH
ncbi:MULTISPECIES: TVP38/TMEM64 family protein [unclassified Halomonas]|uniref:TVP38/TMEM64 family protein n=1 Tax=unclassified Halomonas TaxID=2609666 RepID=UPI0020A0F61A|nr:MULTISPECIES: VTT domain-containing protein [unclassified Halomonas]MCP1314831.1 VTT domain-containing protein [Halomonas sp. 707D7]MCP1327462.1 VTT domain-containing protein [Halomonas sp. 707D4]